MPLVMHLRAGGVVQTPDSGVGLGLLCGFTVVVVVCLVRCPQSETHMCTPIIVPAFDPIVKISFQYFRVVPVITVDQFPFQRGEKGFGGGIVPTHTGPAH